MKENYISPQTETIRMDSLMAPICVSGEAYSIEPGAFDLDSDISILAI